MGDAGAIAGALGAGLVEVEAIDVGKIFNRVGVGAARFRGEICDKVREESSESAWPAVVALVVALAFVVTGSACVIALMVVASSNVAIGLSQSGPSALVVAIDSELKRLMIEYHNASD